jgi:FKBP-type peptidyl-prolyl cis-trans isomerase 2
MKADNGCRVVARSIVRDEAGCVIDAGDRPFRFTVGQYDAIAGIERAVVGHRAGDRLQFVCRPEDAYGAHRPELVFEAPRENLPAELELIPGTLLSPGGSDGRFHLKVLELTESGARLDGNHLLAGKTLFFDLEIVEVRAPA